MLSRKTVASLATGVSASTGEARDAPVPAAGSLRGWSQWRPWRSPAGQPGWARPALLGIAALAAVLYAWNLSRVGLAAFYPVAVKSMSESWKAFWYGALDPGATITIDKLAGSYLPQALSARIFGFHAWALALPQVIEGLVSVLVMYRVVRRWQGPAAGLLAAGIFTLTPIAASMFGHPIEDGLLIMCLILAADALQRAVLEARLRSLVLAGVWVGIGFQAKMLEAWMVLPAFALTYLVAAPAGWRRRLADVTVAGAVTAAVSLSWVLLYTVTPAHDRPFVDGSTSNSAFAMVFGYNGLDRLGIHLSGAAHSTIGANGLTVLGQLPAAVLRFLPPGLLAASRPGGWTQLLSGTFGTQIGWLYPLALLGLVLGLMRARRAPRTDQARGGFILWGALLVTYGVVDSRIFLAHTSYVAALAPPLAALSAAGIVLAWNGYRDGTAVWALPAAIAAEAAWSIYLSSRYPAFLPWLIWIVTAVAVVSLVVLIAAKLRAGVRRAVLLGGMAAGVAAMVAVPAAWSASVLDPVYGGTSFDASAGPGGSTFSKTLAGLGITAGDALNPAQRRLDTYLMAHRDGAEFVAATDSWRSAAPYILATGQAFRPMGGFSGGIPYPTLTEIRQLVNGGRLRYFLFAPRGPLSVPGTAGTPPPGSATARIIGWVEASCAQVPAAAYGDSAGPRRPAPGSRPPTTAIRSAGAGTIFRCAPGS